MDMGGAAARNAAFTLGIICMLLATLVVVNYEIISGKDKIIAFKESEIATLNSKIQTLTSQNDQLKEWLQRNITYYQEEVSTLNLQRSQLQEWLQGNITYYNSKISSLKAEMENLQHRIDSLNAQIATLSGQVSSLKAQYESFTNSYRKLREKVNERAIPTNVKSFITYSDVHNIVYRITGGWSNPSNWDEFWYDVKAMYDWVVKNIEYRPDGLYPVLPLNPSGNLYFSSEMWQLPNETISLRGGDCEDQAILLCSMVRCYTNGEYPVEVIMVRGSMGGHAAVQLPVRGHKVVILDPAGRYYSRNILGGIAFNDVAVEINNWLSYWKPEIGYDVHVSRVFSDYIDRSFTSTDEYIAWMYSR